MSDEKDQEKRASLALASLHAQCETNGVAAIKFEDGEMFMFSRKTIEMLQDKMNAPESESQDRVIVFVKSGPILREN